MQCVTTKYSQLHKIQLLQVRTYVCTCTSVCGNVSTAFRRCIGFVCHIRTYMNRNHLVTLCNTSCILYFNSYQLQKTLGCGVVVSSFVHKVLMAHFIYTLVDKGHEATDGATHLRLYDSE